MPVVHFHVVRPTAEQKRRLLVEATEIYARELDSPLDRIRVFVVGYDPTDVAVGGRIPADGDPEVAFFTALVFAARPIAQRHAVIATFTELLVDVLGIDRAQVRGHVVPVGPDDWGIAGVPAALARAAEIAAHSADAARSGSREQGS